MAQEEELVKIHLGCGAVYLQGWINIDVPDDNFEFAKARPDIVEQNQTTLNNYYKGPYYNNYYERYLLKKRGDKEIPPPNGTPSKDTNRRKVVVDQMAWANKMPYPSNSVETLMCVQVLEHFSLKEATDNLEYWHQLLIPGGRLIVDVPHFTITCDLISLADTNEEKLWGEKLIHGTRNDGFAFHKVGYWPERLSAMLDKTGYSHISPGPNLNHSYPAFSLIAIK